MCGICGFVSKKNINIEALKNMNDSMIHRGPDSSGEEIFYSSGNHIGLAQRRLAIVDLTEQGHQPMYSSDKSICLIFNGEIYNYKELKEQLDYPFSSQSDTEVIIASYLKWGIDCVSHFNGVFAFVLYDRGDDVLFLARDRIGEKPLYYGYLGGSFVFVSELKALKLFPDSHLKVDRDALSLYVKYRYIPAPYSIYENIYKLMPGNYASLRIGSKEAPQITQYWDYISQCTVIERSDQEVTCEFEDLIMASIQRQMAVDVPFGAFLSGGIDSSLITALMQSNSSKPINTYTIGFHEADYNEAEYAKKIASFLGTHHTEYYVTSKESMDVIAKLPHLYDEPFADSSQIPTFLVSKLAGKDLKVALTGDGGDEIFCGYTRYAAVCSAYDKAKVFPLWLRRLAGQMLDISPLPVLKAFAKTTSFNVDDESLRRGAQMLLHSDTLLNMAHATRLTAGRDLVPHAASLPTIWDEPEVFAGIDDCYRLVMAADVLQSLPDNMCVKVDRASMGCSLETRAPLMDYKLVEFSASIPGEQMIKHGAKWMLKGILSKYVPKELFERPKMGFSIPVGEWIRKEMRPWAEDLLSTAEADGYFEPKALQKLWISHIKGRENNTMALWTILMFQVWLREN